MQNIWQGKCVNCPVPLGRSAASTLLTLNRKLPRHCLVWLSEPLSDSKVGTEAQRASLTTDVLIGMFVEESLSALGNAYRKI